MMRGLRSRVLATMLALPAAFAVPGVAVAHGVDHAESRHHAAEHAVEGRTAADLLEHHETPIVSDAAGHGDDHQHPSFRAGVSGKVDGIGFLLTVARFELPSAQLDFSPRAPFARTRVKAHGSHAPPPNLRGPPGIIG